MTLHERLKQTPEGWGLGSAVARTTVVCWLITQSRLTFWDPVDSVARQAPLSTGISRQECWSGRPLPPPGDLLNRGVKPASPALQAGSPEPPGKPWTAVADSVYEAETDADAEDKRMDAQRGGGGVNWDAEMDTHTPPIMRTQQIPGRTEWAAQDSAPRSADLNGKEIQGQGTCEHAQLAQLVAQKPTHHKGKRSRQSCPTLFCPVDCSPPGFSIHGVLQARLPEWVAFPFSRRSSRPRDRTWVSRIAGRSFTL